MTLDHQLGLTIRRHTIGRKTLDVQDDYVFTLARARQGLAINELCWSLKDGARRKVFAADEAVYCDQFGLTDPQRDAVVSRDWVQLLELGGSIFHLLKLAQVDGVSVQYLGGVFSGTSETEFLAMMRSGGRR